MISPKVLIIEDEYIIASNLKNIIKKMGLKVCRLAHTYDAAISIFEEERPDLIISDIFLHNSQTGIEAILNINSKCNRYIPILIVSAYHQESVLEDAMKVNPIYFITKPFTEPQIVTAVRMIIRICNINADITVPTSREIDVLRLLANGMSSKLIANELHITVNTVETHRKNMMQRYAAKTSSELIFFSTSKGWIK